jgi:hypothetical protein
MATSTIPIPKNVWTIVSTVSVQFQVQGQSSVFIIESVALPTEDDLSIRKTAIPGQMYAFDKIDGDFYAYSKDVDTEISIDPVA